MTSRTTRTDENSQFGSTANGLAAKNVAFNATRRAALGDLVNRTKPNVVGVDATKKNAISNAADTAEKSTLPSGIVDMKKVKARVDTHWSRPLTRSNSVKVSTTVKTEATSSIAAGPKLLKARTATTATLREVKIVPVTKAAAVIKKSKSPERPTIKRQESNLSQKLLLKTGASNAIAAIPKVVVKVDADEDSINKKKLQTKKSQDLDAYTGPKTTAHSADMLGYFNIDAGDEANPWLVSEYVNDIYSYLYHLESIYGIKKNHLAEQNEVIPKMRAVLIDWISEVHLQYHFVQETFHMAVSLIDRYLQKVKTTSRQNLQLVGVAALFISSKYEELYPPDISDFVYITDDTYNKHEVMEMEKHILKKLKFELGNPLSIHFLRRYSKAANANAITHAMSKYFIELAAVEYNLCEYLPSQIAASALYISLCINNKSSTRANDKLWTDVLAYHSTYDLVTLKPLVKKLAECIINAPTAKLNNVHKKYQSTKNQGISMTVEKAARVLENIIYS